MMLFLLVLVLVPAVRGGTSIHPIALPNCLDRCGDESIPYPFGLTENCSLNSDFQLLCRTAADGRRHLEKFANQIEILNISSEPHELTMAVSYFGAEDCYSNNNNQNYTTISFPSWLKLSSTKNRFTVVGCDSYGYLSGVVGRRNFSTGCMSVCDSAGDVADDGSCSGAGCCHLDVPSMSLESLSVEARSYYGYSFVRGFSPCTYAFVAKEGAFRFERRFLVEFSARRVPFVVDWVVPDAACRDSEKPFCLCGKDNTELEPFLDDGGFRCRCRPGFRGNPYLPDGCQTDIDECLDRSLNNCTIQQSCNNTIGSYVCIDIHTHQFPLLQITVGILVGVLALSLSGSWIYWVLNKRKLIKLKEKFFRQNGGLILEQKISRHGSEKYIYTADELSKATNNYHESRVLGQGGSGTVYKGVLSDNKVVAIKKSKIGDQGQIGQFINEVIVLSQINHANVVKLLGCCLETEVPLLVYEFITNGTVSEHIHVDGASGKYASLSWEMRLKIAAQTAGAISYLHSSASMPIIHRDIKTANILLDENYIAKVSDFGASRLVPLDKTQLTTLVQGTLGYLDPEYFQSSQLTEKSDVYSFGVVLAELITGQKALSFARSERDRNLAMYFISSLKEDLLFNIIDENLGLVEENIVEQIKIVANIGKSCLRVRGEDRPTMKEVASELERLKQKVAYQWEKEDHHGFNSDELTGSGEIEMESNMMEDSNILIYM